ncbi:MAG: hypothetical protein B6D55_02385 [Candidatus Omnitrophica bacterium 4484_70.2]|nr:MAG: hypothetical protein B6D55_02385 [Candidatus Omnitrophica bacterium 4484_70.2]
MKYKGLDVQGQKRKGRYYWEQLAEYKQLKKNIEAYTKAGLPFPPALRAKLETFRTMEISLKRMGLIK